MNNIGKSFIFAFRQTSKQNGYLSTTILGRKFSYESDLSLDKIYPGSRQKLFTPTMLPSEGDKFNGFIPLKKLEINYSRSSGTGGQHVNCVNTKVDVRFKIAEATWIPEKTKHKMIAALQNNITNDGYYFIKSDLTRSQQMNLADALEKLRCVIRKFEYEAPPSTEQTLEQLRKRQENASRLRLLVKRQRSKTKEDRRGPSDENFQS